MESIGWFMLHLSFKALDGLPTYDQWVKEKVTGNIWQKTKLRFNLVPGFIYRHLDKNGSLIMLHPLHNVLRLTSGLLPTSSRQLAKGCRRLSD